MMPTSSMIKRNAKAVLSNQWSSAFAVGCLLLSALALFLVFVQFFVMLVPQQGNALLIWLFIIFGFLISQLFLAPLLYGCIRWFWFVSDGAELTVHDVFYFFESWHEYKRAVMLCYFIFIRVISILLICFLPYAVIYAIGNPKLYEAFHSGMPYWVSLVWLLKELAVFLGTLFAFVMLLRFFMAPILLINDENLAPKEALRLSYIVSKGGLFQYIGFILSFGLWFLFSLLVLPLLFVTPYYLCSFTLYCRCVIQNYNNNIDLLSKTNFPYYRSSF